MHPTTPDGRYFVVNGRLWRCSNPALPKDARQHLVQQLMSARRAVKQAKRRGDTEALKEARTQVHESKLALGERGPVWWQDASPDFNRHDVENTPYAAWFRALGAASGGQD